jgi:hypothetical protein
MGYGRIFLKNHRSSLFYDDLSKEHNFAGSISLDSSFKKHFLDSKDAKKFESHRRLYRKYRYLSTDLIFKAFKQIINFVALSL